MFIPVSCMRLDQFPCRLCAHRSNENSSILISRDWQYYFWTTFSFGLQPIAWLAKLARRRIVYAFSPIFQIFNSNFIATRLRICENVVNFEKSSMQWIEFKKIRRRHILALFFDDISHSTQSHHKYLFIFNWYIMYRAHMSGNQWSATNNWHVRNKKSCTTKKKGEPE